MATAKKPATKKKATTTKKKATTARKTTTVRKTAAKKAPVKKTTRKAASRKKAPNYESMKLCKEGVPFLTYKISDQTIYWLTLSIVVFVLSLWVLHLHLEVATILNGIY